MGPIPVAVILEEKKTDRQRHTEKGSHEDKGREHSPASRREGMFGITGHHWPSLEAQEEARKDLS